MLPFLKTKNRRLPLTRFSMTALPLLSPILPPTFPFAFFSFCLLPISSFGFVPPSPPLSIFLQKNADSFSL